ncbi:MAG: 3'(2'),5'-bisphosphate nucleotidase CysQ [Gemmataceae bacterium]|nr:3'(2'),5'-bisphosphate nucleotidase CysQ [Gemmataceae bacterium]
MTDQSAELRAALECAARASARIMELYASFAAISDAPAEISTQADRDSQEIILQALCRAFPADAKVAEESTPTQEASPRAGRRLWIVDPIDGTRGFAQKNGEFSVMVALAVDGEAVVGVVQEPALGRVTFAEKGRGCWRIDGGTAAQPCRVRENAALDRCILVQSRSRKGETSKAARVLAPARIDETHSAGVKLARVARGEADVYANHYASFKDWDIAAGDILVAEADGLVTGLGGEAIRYGGEGNRQESGLLAASSAIHAAALAALRG